MLRRGSPTIGYPEKREGFWVVPVLFPDVSTDFVRVPMQDVLDFDRFYAFIAKAFKRNPSDVPDEWEMRSVWEKEDFAERVKAITEPDE